MKQPEVQLDFMDKKLTLSPGQHVILAEIDKLESRHVPRIRIRHEAARTLGIHPNTLYTQLRRICERLGARDWRDVVRWWQASNSPPVNQAELAKQWKGAGDAKAPLVAKLDEAERGMREVLLHPLTAERWPEAMPELLKALESLDKARECLRARQILLSRRS
jgi:hypothetical protein